MKAALCSLILLSLILAEVDASFIKHKMRLRSKVDTLPKCPVQLDDAEANIQIFDEEFN